MSNLTEDKQDQIVIGGQLVQPSIQSKHESVLSSENEASMMKKLQAFSNQNMPEDAEVAHLVPTEYVFGQGIK